MWQGRRLESIDNDDRKKEGQRLPVRPKKAKTSWTGLFSVRFVCTIFLSMKMGRDILTSYEPCKGGLWIEISMVDHLQIDGLVNITRASAILHTLGRLDGDL